jgi:hypothetical protein
LAGSCFHTFWSGAVWGLHRSRASQSDRLPAARAPPSWRSSGLRPHPFQFTLTGEPWRSSVCWILVRTRDMGHASRRSTRNGGWQFHRNHAGPEGGLYARRSLGGSPKPKHSPNLTASIAKVPGAPTGQSMCNQPQKSAKSRETDSPVCLENVWLVRGAVIHGGRS